MLHLKTGEIAENLPATMMVEGEHLWFEWEAATGHVMPCCRWCMAVMPSDPDKQKSRCKGLAEIVLHSATPRLAQIYGIGRSLEFDGDDEPGDFAVPGDDFGT